jgi:hypothetical protein|tara:strand:+ start:192 stop:755 length:564 start_codon:yes stop_codon:yes gene_type:complete
MSGKFLSTLKKAATVAGDVLTSKGDILTRTASVLARLAVGSDGKVLTAKASEATGLSWETPTVYDVNQSFIIACSDESTALTTGTAKVSFRMPYAFTLTAGEGGVRASCNQAPTGAILTMDINEAGSTILSTKLTIAIGSTTSVGGTAPVISDVNLADNALMTIDIDQIGSTNPGTGLKVTLIGVKA